MVLISSISYGQNRSLITDKIEIKESLKVRNNSVNEISYDTSMAKNSDSLLVSQKAIKAYIENRKAVSPGYNLQQITTLGYKTSNSVLVKSIVVSDTIQSGFVGVGSSGSFAAGVVQKGVDTIAASGIGSHASGMTQIFNSALPSIINASGISAYASGNVYNSGYLLSKGYASFAHGYISSTLGSKIISSGYGSFAVGIVNSGTNYIDSLTASGNGSFAGGYVANGSAVGQTGSSIISTANGSFGYGYATGYSAKINASGAGGFASGYAGGTGGGIGGTIQVTTAAQGGFAQGLAASGGVIQSTAIAGFAHGRTQINGSITASGQGSLASGWISTGTLAATGYGSTAFGSTNQSTFGGTIISGGAGSFVSGATDATSDSIYSTGRGSGLIGNRLVNYGNYSMLFGYNLRNEVSNVTKIGYNKDQLTVDGNNDKVTILSRLSLGSTDVLTAQISMDATDKGFLLNRMSQVQRLAINAPAIGLMVYQTDAIEGIYINKSDGWHFAY